mmetsp:Transcript_11394/g.22586  ORF Transcript_11394/g.22586 Transcript_11394/m.22586 type:complete len:238 (-) Transcript_11394:273-986(-)
MNIRPCFRYTYILGNSVYVPLTSYSNTVTLPATRGPKFVLPPEVVGCLDAVRTDEGRRPYGSTADPGGRVSGPPTETLVRELDARTVGNGGAVPPDVVLAGEGEPLLRFRALLDVAAAASSRGSCVRVVTNGLVPAGGPIADAVAAMRAAGVGGVTVALVAAGAERYGAIMRPAGLEAAVAHGAVCDFVVAAVGCGMDVEVAGVNFCGTDWPSEREAVENLAASLGVTKVRWRPYFP